MFQVSSLHVLCHLGADRGSQIVGIYDDGDSGESNIKSCENKVTARDGAGARPPFVLGSVSECDGCTVGVAGIPELGSRHSRWELVEGGSGGFSPETKSLLDRQEEGLLPPLPGVINLGSFYWQHQGD